MPRPWEKAALDLKQQQGLALVELWAFGGALRLVLIEHLCANLDSERVVSLMLKGLRLLEQISWRILWNPFRRWSGCWSAIPREFTRRWISLPAIGIGSKWKRWRGTRGGRRLRLPGK